ncbi:thiamine phosphate synthase [Clostridium sp. BJN0013]|uniref:thiamine phosphate synthase n=1 Tax=Clostridium sp. BJN0013 TaxID=3236840 RepID=UPI0034C5C37B
MVICVTNRLLCKDNFLNRIEQIARAKPEGIILREKDLLEYEYEQLAYLCHEICLQYKTSLIIHTYIEVAKKLGISKIHMPLKTYLKNHEQLTDFTIKGTSVHTIEEAIQAQIYGADYIIAGHIFPTDCKKGMPARGLDFLESVCCAVSIPVFAIGGIKLERMIDVYRAKASGVCIMSYFMECSDPEKACDSFKVFD